MAYHDCTVKKFAAWINNEGFTSEQLRHRQLMMTALIEHQKKHHGCCGGKQEFLMRLHNMKYTSLLAEYASKITATGIAHGESQQAVP